MRRWRPCLLQPDLFFGSPPRLTAWAPQHWPVANDWRPVVDGFLSSEPGRQLADFIRLRLDQGAIMYPPQPFRALELTSLADVKVVILGQDPYHGPWQAEGLAFSVAPGVKPPPSLRNIFKELDRERSLGLLPPPVGALTLGNGSLVRWAQQGVLLLNTCLTVELGLPASHAQRGWDVLTDAIVKAVAMKDEPVVFMLWGAHAQAKQGLIRHANELGRGLKQDHDVLVANHPSPLSALRHPKPFLGCGHFGQANEFLKKHGHQLIAW